MFRSMRLRNFKCYKDSGEIPLKPLSILIGANNSGKSTVLHALLAIKQTIEDFSPKPALATSGLVELGGYYDILHGKGAKKECSSIGISLITEPSQQAILRRKGQPILMCEELDLTFSFSEKAKEIELDRCIFRTGGKVLIEVFPRSNKWSSEEYVGKEFAGKDLEFRNFFPRFAIGASHRTRIKRLSEKTSRFLASVDFQSHAWSHEFAHHVHRIGPHRLHVPWYSGTGARGSSELGNGHNLITALGSTEERWGGRTLLDFVNEWVLRQKVLKRIHPENVDKAGKVRMLLGDEFNGLKNINVAAMGEGISQMLPIITSLVESGPGGCLLIEQPEIHLHPALQAGLADLFIESVLEQPRQLIVETHSEHLLLRIRRRIAENKLDHKQVAVLFVEKDGDESTIRRLDLNGRGHFNDWPSGFFDEGYAEAMALAKAASKKPRES